MKSGKIVLQQTELQLLPEKAVFLPEFQTLCIADWHLGKAAHFRKAGIALPQPDLSLEFDKLSRLIDRYDAQQVILLGDIFHSDLNKDWFHFEEFIKAHAHIAWIITMGNHDLPGKAKFSSLGINATDEFRLGNRIIGTHHPLENVPEDCLNIAGHVHPGCEIFTPARQTFKLPCFHYSRSVLTLPAFGGLTGLFILKPDEHNRIFPIIGDEVKEIRFNRSNS
ncbi:ligase-associated DNA damage response endonuclease PdeM [Fluviicola sp.]|uniref:ligase-associated DNA damage response endonuclease PdeM n=1 Tax=Fluviicola sp. TaxID=1917219 RepID=UPI0031D31675